jgi:hypothetical protein
MPIEEVQKGREASPLLEYVKYDRLRNDELEGAKAGDAHQA